MKIEDISAMPGMTGGGANSSSMDNYVVKYLKADMNEPADMMELSDIQTKAVRAKPGKEEVVLISENSFTFMDKMFLVIKYLEKVTG